MLDTNSRWQITAELSNNKTDRYVVTAVELAKFIHKERRAARRIKVESSSKDPIRPKEPTDIWLIDLIFKKLSEYLERFKMVDVDIMNICIEKVD
jgi:hypothetical protein